MRVRHSSDRLARLETDIAYSAGFDEVIVRAYRKVMFAIRAANDERDLRALKSLRYEKLKGKRAHQRSLRLNDQWRLIVEIEGTRPRQIVVVAIEDYH